jgi:hypothetical protein
MMLQFYFIVGGIEELTSATNEAWSATRCAAGRKEERKQQNRRNEKDEGFALENPMAPLSVQDRRSSTCIASPPSDGGIALNPHSHMPNNRPFIPGLEIPSQSTWQISIRVSWTCPTIHVSDLTNLRSWSALGGS